MRFSPPFTTACRWCSASDDWPAWLGESGATDDDLKAMLTPYPAERMTLWPVDKRVGNVKNDSADLFEPIGDALTVARA